MSEHPNDDPRHHLVSKLMRESLLDREVERQTETPVFSMLPDTHVVKIGGRSIFDRGREAVYPLVAVLREVLEENRLILATGGGVRTRHVYSVGLDLGLPTGALAQLAAADALGTAHMLGALLSPQGVVAIPPEIFGHLLPFFIRATPGVIYNGLPPYNLWEQPPAIGRIPPHGSDAGCLLLAECFGSKTLTLVKDVDGVFEEDPAVNPKARFIPEISASELQERGPSSLPFDRVALELLQTARLLKSFQVVNGLKPELVARAIQGEHVGTIVRAA